MAITLEISAGAMSPKLSEQIARQGMSADKRELALLQKDADAITRLSIRRFISDKEASRARRKLCDRVAQITRPLKLRPAEK